MAVVLATVGLYGGLSAPGRLTGPKAGATCCPPAVGTPQAINTRYNETNGLPTAPNVAALTTRFALFGVVGDSLRAQCKPTPALGSSTLGLGSSRFSGKYNALGLDVTSGFYLTCALQLAKAVSESSLDINILEHCCESAGWVSAIIYHPEGSTPGHYDRGVPLPPAKRRAPLGQARQGRAKKIATNNHNDEGEEDEGEQPPRRRPQPEPIDPAKPPKRYFACPFYKYDPVRHWRCYRKYEFRRPYDVTTHLERLHVISDYYCAKCFKEFDDERKWWEHDTNACLEISGPERLWKEDVVDLREIPTSRGTSDAEKWYCLWDRVFPGVERPSSPYMSEGFDEALALARENGWRRLEGALPGILSDNGFPIEDGDLHTLLGDLVNILVPETTAEMAITQPYQRPFHRRILERFQSS
ncbi:unnamed protein product [Clonostachys rhizophaga]|uniref:C2H2-type domain-containing protein n=1 Tax=Clonostachys rhizophaga TaxID=160324 RepID=A0A9N9VSN9_9HYPO|nr:unnamed protein product [Clonostachys rhizophaga]